MNYKVEADFEHEGYKCIVIITNMGHRCGYVGIPKEHPLYNHSYSQKVSNLKRADVENSPIGKRSPIVLFCSEFEEDLSPEQYFNVHGGITFSDGGEESVYPVESDLWWFGYDCNHYNDAKDINYIENENLREIEMSFGRMGIVRSLEYCKEECKRLAEQLKRVS